MVAEWKNPVLAGC